MSELTIFTAEKPNAAKKDFLATTEPLNSLEQNNELPLEIIIDRYTRDPWSRLSSSSENWQGLWLKSVDKRGRIPGFIKFLKGRAKAAFGKFDSPPDEVTGEDRRGLFLVPYEQPPYPSKETLANGDIVNDSDLIFVKYCFDERDVVIVEATQPKVPNTQITTKVHPMIPSKNQNLPTTYQDVSVKSRRGGRLLETMLEAQERTNRNLDAVPKKSTNNASSMPISNIYNGFPNPGGQSSETPVFFTSNQVICHFRSKVEKKLLAFASSSETATEILINHAEEIRTLQSLEEKEKVSMEVLKYIVFEQSDDIGEDEWVASKQPSEFMDEATIAIYKAGFAPKEVIEDLYKAEMPDEAKQQQRAMREELNREMKKKEKLNEEINLKKAFEQNHEVKRLNNVKRDRRSIEEIQRDMMNSSKRSKS